MSEPKPGMRIAPVSGLVGLGLIGYGLDGILGAGVGLVLPHVVLVVSQLVYDLLARPSADRRRRKTLRHRFLLWIDRRRVKKVSNLRERVERKEAERKYLASRARRRAGGHP
jgi:hypothetical protein